jgi:hypothetical protein
MGFNWVGQEASIFNSTEKNKIKKCIEFEKS